MAVQFYSDSVTGSTNVTDIVKCQPLIFRPFKECSSISVTLLPKGNLIMEYIPLTEWITEKRHWLLKKYSLVQERYQSYENCVVKKTNKARHYLAKNIFNNRKENQELLLPGVISATSAFFLGRIITNPMNWNGQRIINLSYKSAKKPGSYHLARGICTNLLSRLLVPIFFASVTLLQVVPITSNNIWESMERDLLPSEVVQKYHHVWTEIYEEKYLKGSQRVNTLIHRDLQERIKEIRRMLIEKMPVNNYD